MSRETAASPKKCPECGCRWRDASKHCPECGSSVNAAKVRKAKAARPAASVEFHPKKLLAIAIGLLGTGVLGHQFTLNAYNGHMYSGDPLGTGGRIGFAVAAIVCFSLWPLFIVYARAMFRR